ncbi:MAG TPA: hypothetical protein DCX14_06370 [Flavobacteriales bacterium]|nr:hypothetical protein [Flavobacteriales bacterium]
MTNPTEVIKSIQVDHDATLKKLEGLIQNIDARYAFLALYSSKLFKTSRHWTEQEDGMTPALFELAAFYLFPHFGKNEGSRHDGEIQQLIDTLEELNRTRAFLCGFTAMSDSSDFSEITSQIRTQTETVRGSGYPYQTRKLIEGIHGRFESWFVRQCGIGPIRCLEILEVYQKVLNLKFREHHTQFHKIRARGTEYLQAQGLSPEDVQAGRCNTEKWEGINQEIMDFMHRLPEILPLSFQDTLSEMSSLTQVEWDGFRNLIGLTQESINAFDEVNAVRKSPTFFTASDRFIFFDLSSVYDALLNAFDTLARKDQKFKDSRYVKHTAEWMENETASHLQRVFPKSTVYKNLKYPDPDNPGGETELDVAVHWGPFLLLGEVKGTQFRDRSRLGAASQLRTDLERSIGAAFSQASRAQTFIESAESVEFTEKDTGRVLVIRKEQLRRIFPLSITLHHFGGIATQLAQLKKIGLFKGSSYPWSVSLSDLELITSFVEEPDIFLHYIQRRIELQKSEKNIHGDEIDTFGIYLDNRLNPDELWNMKTDHGEDLSMIALTGGSARFDEWHQAKEKGNLEAASIIGLNLPDEFMNIIQELRNRSEDSSRWIAFALLGLSNDGIAQFIGDLSHLRDEAQADRRVRRVTFKDGNLTVSILVTRGATPNELQKQTVFRASLEKYRHRTNASVAIGIDAGNSNRPFDYAMWEEGEWEHEETMEKVLDSDNRSFIPKSKLPGRNEPCICGSGRKFKKCCLDRINTIKPTRK